jgi:adenine phosphoribosyltransferase
MTASPSAADAALIESLKATIRDVPDFPKPGIVFKDITPVLSDRDLFRRATQAMAAPFATDDVSYVVGVESRGFILGAPVAIELGAGFIPVRKPGKLPHRTTAAEYALEYGTDSLEIHDRRHGVGHVPTGRGAWRRGGRLLVLDRALVPAGAEGAGRPAG